MDRCWILGLLALVACSHAAHADCATKDLNAEPNSPLAAMPIYDQDGSGSCYAHAASQLVTYEVNQEKGVSPDNEINPIFAAWVEKYEDSLIKSDGLDGGFAVQVIDSLRKKGACTPATVVKSLHILKYGCAKTLNDAQLIHLLELLYDNYTRFAFNHLQADIDRVKEINKAQPRYSDCQIEMVGGLAQLNGLLNVPATEVLSTLFKDCTRTSLSSLPEPAHYGYGGDEKMISELDASLDHGKPAAIALCAELFDDLRTTLKGRSPPLNRGSIGNLPWKCGGHEVLVTARKELNGSCKYLVRNSWGALWRAPAVMSCACIRFDGKYEDVCHDPLLVREYVGCWFDQTILGRNITDVTTFYHH